jgi:drug/metabolite transporter (DMT)-like permease
VNFVPVLTAGLAALLLGERLDAAQAAGGVAVLMGVWWTTRARVARPPIRAGVAAALPAAPEMPIRRSARG